MFTGKKGKLRSNSGKMTGTKEEPMEVKEEGGNVLVRKESEEETEKLALKDIPAYTEGRSDTAELVKSRSPGSEEGLFLSEKSDEGSHHDSTLRRKEDVVVVEEDSDKDDDDKKKLAMNTIYDGFSIYGRILCLVVKRKGLVKGQQPAGGTGQAMMEEWVASTQAGQGQTMED